MIHALIFTSMSNPLNIGGSFAQQVTINPWHAIKQCMEGTHDHIIWIVTKAQHGIFMAKLKEYDLLKYCVVAHTDFDKDGTANRNYPKVPRKLKVFIMKGAKAK